MAIKKVKKTQADIVEPVASASDLEEKRKQFQRAAKGKKALTSTPASPKVRSTRRRTIIMIVGALLLTLSSATAVYAYFAWSNSPEKIVADALTNAASSQSVTYTANIASRENSIATINGQYVDGKSEMNGVINTGLSGNLAKIDASVVATQRDIYVKLSDATQLAQTAIPSEQARVVDLILPVLQKQIDDKWIQMNTSDMALFQPATKVTNCSAEGIRTLTTDQRARMALAQLYAAHPFLVITDNGSRGNQGVYRLSIERSKLSEFLDSLQSSDLKDSVAGCSEEIAWIKKSDVGAIAIELNIDTSTRTITRAQVAIETSNPISVTLVPQFNQQITIDEPQAAIKLNDIKALLYSAFEKLQAN